MKDKAHNIITFQKISKKSSRKRNKIGVDKGNEFNNTSMKSYLEKNDIGMYSTHNKWKSVVAERFVSTLKMKIYKYMTSISKNVYIDKLDDTINKCNNTYHRTIKMKPVDVKWNIYINSSKELNDKDPIFKIGDIVRISKEKNIFAKGYVTNWSEEDFVIKKVKKILRCGHMSLVILKEKKLLEGFLKQNCKKTNQEEFRVKKVIKRKGDKLCVKWKGCDNSFNSWIDKKDIV